MGLLTTILQVILSLSLLVILHEGGHFLAAKLFKTKVEKFYLFFNPWFSLFKFKKGDTEYGLGWLPFGGYVKIAGMIDESFDKKQLEGEVQPWEFRAKPAWQRLIIMLGGIIVNIILGIAIFAMLSYSYGDKYIKADSLKYGIHVDSVGYKLGLREGDKILAIGDKKLEVFDKGKILTDLILEGVKTIKVERNGEIIDIKLPEDTPQILIKTKGSFVFDPRMPFEIAGVMEGTPAEKAGLQKDDKLIEINGEPVHWYYEVKKKLKENAGKDITLTIVRNGSDTIKTQTHLGDNGMLGVKLYAGDHFFKFKVIKYGFLESIKRGAQKSWDFISGQAKAFKKMFTGELPAKDSIGSVISMGKMFGDTWDSYRFWNLTASLSILLAFLNLLPIPGLDGGHAMFVLYEMITGRKPSDKVVEVATTIGFVLLIILMVFALGNDIRKLF